MLATMPLYAQTENPGPARPPVIEAASPTAVTPAPETTTTVTGSAAVVNESVTKEGRWRSLIFISGALIVAAVGVTLVAINAGHTAND
jgi:hypothetical protein